MIFLTRLYEQKEEKNLIQKSKIGLVNSDYIFQKNVADGLMENEQQFSIINVLPVGAFPNQYADFCLKSKRWNYKGIKCEEIGSLNIPFFKQFQRSRRIFKILKNSSDKEILVYAAYTPFLKAISKLDKSYKVTLIVTDLPEYYFLQKSSFIIRLFKNYNIRACKKYMERVDRFVLLTDPMAKRMKVGKRPYTVVEGICPEMTPGGADVTKTKKKAIFYSGALREKDGIKNLVDAFSKMQDTGIELQICGKGEMEDYVVEAAKKDARIKYLGYVGHDKVLEFERSAKLLVNPRQNAGDFTKYSFPSKTMEYLASGTPVLMYKLDGIPDEYDNYIYYVDGNSVDDLKGAIEEVMNKSQKELDQFGGKAREWVLGNKNAKAQVKKILEVITL